MPLTPEVVDTLLQRMRQRMAQIGDTAKTRRLWEIFGTKKTFDDSPEERESSFEQLWQSAAGAFPSVTSTR